jgi:hypothetical protein
VIPGSVPNANRISFVLVGGANLEWFAIRRDRCSNPHRAECRLPPPTTMPKDHWLAARRRKQRARHAVEHRTRRQHPISLSILCDQCHGNMRLIDGKYGKFWGCTSYPSCRWTRRYVPEHDGHAATCSLPCDASACDDCDREFRSIGGGEMFTAHSVREPPRPGYLTSTVVEPGSGPELPDCPF